MRILGLLLLACIALSSCSRAQGEAEVPRTAVPEPAPQVPPAIGMSGPAASAPRRQTRMTERDDDADGIADYRVFVTESFDAAGNLVGVTTEQDFEADGVIDERETTNFL